jgi:hypothetical protein
MAHARGAGDTALSILASSRSAFRIVVLLPAWLWLTAVEAALPRAESAAGKLFSGCVLGTGGLLVWAWAAFDGARAGRREAPPWFLDRVRALGDSTRRLLVVPLVTFFPAAFFFLLAVGGAVLLRQVPFAGDWLGRAWVFTGGLFLSVIAAGWALLALASLPLEVAAAVSEEEATPMDVFSWATHTARVRPLHLAWGWILVLAGTLAGAILFLAFFLIAGSFLVALDEVAAGSLPSSRSFDPLWRVAFSLRGWSPCGEWAPAPPTWLVHAARFLPAFVLSSLLAGTGRVYVALRSTRAG